MADATNRIEQIVSEIRARICPRWRRCAGSGAGTGDGQGEDRAALTYVRDDRWQAVTEAVTLKTSPKAIVSTIAESWTRFRMREEAAYDLGADWIEDAFFGCLLCEPVHPISAIPRYRRCASLLRVARRRLSELPER